MPSKSKAAHVFKIGDPAVVRDIRSGRLMNCGTIVKTTGVYVVFEGPTNDPQRLPTLQWGYRRKGTRWIEVKKDCYELLPQPPNTRWVKKKDFYELEPRP